MKRFSQTNQAGGFTIVEVMLAVTILALVIVAVSTTWSTALTAWKRGTAVMESFQRERIVMETLEDLAQSAVFFTSKPELYQVQSSQTPGLGDTVSFVTASDMLLPRSEALAAGLRRVTLSLRRDHNGVVYLAIANTPAVVEATDEQDIQWHVLSADVVGFAVRYRHPRDGTWHDRWDEPNLVPAAMMFTVAFRSDDKRLPPLQVTRAVELAGAEAALDALGQPLSQQDTTNTVTRQEIDLSQSDTGNGGGGADE